MSTTRDLAAAVAAADRALDGLVVRTPLVPSPWLAAQTGADVRLKLENVQHTGSFKFRGASHALQRLPAAAARAGVVAASSGNHGLGLAAAAAARGVRAEIFVPVATAPAKLAAIRAHGATVVPFGDDCVDTEQEARRVATATGRAYVSPYNDAAVVAGQGSIAVELLAQWPEVEVLYVALGGGGLCAGVAAYAKSHRPGLEIVACSPAASPAMAECVRRGAIVDVRCGDTLSDSTAGGVEQGAITFPWCRELVDRFVDVDEPAIAAALLQCLEHQHLLIEGAAAVPIAALLQDRHLRGRRAAVIVCGGNLPLAKLRALLVGGPTTR